jgi:hypothetical protein
VLTDDDLTRQLGAAFHAETDDMTYDGAVPKSRTRPVWARPGLIALPAVGAVAAAVLVFGSINDPTPPASPAAPTAAPSADVATGTATADGAVTEELELAGMTFTVTREQAEDFSDDLLAEYPLDALPAWAEPVELESGASAKVWVGVDPGTGRANLIVESPVRYEGRLTGLASPNLSVEQMIEVAKTGTFTR